MKDLKPQIIDCLDTYLFKLKQEKKELETTKSDDTLIAWCQEDINKVEQLLKDLSNGNS